MPEISVIIPTFNRAKSLEETLKSLAGQTLEPSRYEVIVVDDGSTDDTRQCVARFASEHPALCLRYERHSTNRFRAAACNTGVRAARGTLIVFTDDDIRTVPGWLEANIKRHEIEKRNVAVTGLVCYPDGWVRQSNWVRFANENYRLNETIKRGEMGNLPPNRFAGGNTSLRRDVFMAAGMFNETIRRSEDVELGSRLYEMGVPLLYEPKALAYHFADAIKSIEGTLRSFRRSYEIDRPALRERYPWYFERYGHWFLEPVDADNDGLRRMLAKRIVRTVTRRVAQRLLVHYLKLVDGVRWLYWRPLYQYVMACEALDAIRTSEQEGGTRKQLKPTAEIFRVVLCAVVGVLLVAGCRHQPQKAIGSGFYPVGICGSGNPVSLPAIHQAGFNLVYGKPEAAYLEAARSNSLAVLADLPHPGALKTFDKHPSVWAWFLEDEPEMQGICPARVLEKHRFVKSCGGQKPTAVVLFKGYEALDYGNIADITVCDRYPVPWLPLCNFGQHLRMVRLALGKQKPLIAIVQAFDWRYYAEMLSDVDPASLRPPTYDEIRCMTYCALAQRVNGLMYYSYDDGPGRWRMQEHPETWRALCKVVQEVNARLPLFQAEHVWWPKDQRWQDPARRFNAALESSIDSVLLRVTTGNAAIPTGCYVLGVNNTDQQHVYSFTVPFRIAGKVSVFEENRDLVAQNGWLTDTFAPYAVHVYGPLLRVGN